MRENEMFSAKYRNADIFISGGSQNEENGFIFKVLLSDEPGPATIETEVSAWKIEFSSMEKADEAFRLYFGIGIERAAEKDGIEREIEGALSYLEKFVLVNCEQIEVPVDDSILDKISTGTEIVPDKLLISN